MVFLISKKKRHVKGNRTSKRKKNAQLSRVVVFFPIALNNKSVLFVRKNKLEKKSTLLLRTFFFLFVCLSI